MMAAILKGIKIGIVNENMINVGQRPFLFHDPETFQIYDETMKEYYVCNFVVEIECSQYFNELSIMKLSWNNRPRIE